MNANEELEEAAAEQQQALRVNAGLLRAGAILVGVGGATGFAGLTIGGLAVAAAFRQWAANWSNPSRNWPS